MTGNTNKERRRLERERIQAQKKRRRQLERAAPDLLMACKTVIAYLDQLELGLPDNDPLIELRRRVHGPLRDKLEPAIALAEEVA